MAVTLEDKWIGERLVQAGILTDEQRNNVLKIQSEPINSHIRFGDIAVDEGLCTHKQIDSIGGFLGELLVERKVLTQEQVDKLLEMQANMREARLYVPTFGELALMQEFCSKEDIENAIIFGQRNKPRNIHSSNKDTSDW